MDTIVIFTFMKWYRSWIRYYSYYMNILRHTYKHSRGENQQIICSQSEWYNSMVYHVKAYRNVVFLYCTICDILVLEQNMALAQIRKQLCSKKIVCIAPLILVDHYAQPHVPMAKYQVYHWQSKSCIIIINGPFSHRLSLRESAIM